MIATRPRLLPPIKSKPCSFIQMPQTTGTCWFHALMNGFLLSKYGRPYLEETIREYEEKNGKIENLKSINFCPMKYHEHFSHKGLYFSIIKKFLRFGIKNKYNTLQGFFPNQTNIENRGGRTQILVKYNELNKLYKMLFGNEYLKDFLITEYSTYKFNMENRISAKINTAVFSDIPHIRKEGDDNYVLSHAQIAGTSRDGGHAITGFVCDDNKYYIYNYGQTFLFDWTKKDSENSLREYFFKNVFPRTDVNDILILITAVWIKKESITNEKINKSRTNKTEVLKLRNNLKKLENSRKNILDMMNYNYFNNQGTRLVLKKKVNAISAQMKNIKNKIGNSNMYIPNVGNLRRVGFSPKKQLQRTPNKKNVRVPIAIQTNEARKIANKARKRSNIIRQTTSMNRAFVKPKNNSQSRAINASGFKNKPFGALNGRPSNKLINSRRIMRANRNRGQIFSHNPMLVINKTNKASTPNKNSSTTITFNTKPENMLKILNGMTENQISSLNTNQKRAIFSLAAKGMQNYYGYMNSERPAGMVLEPYKKLVNLLENRSNENKKLNVFFTNNFKRNSNKIIKNNVIDIPYYLRGMLVFQKHKLKRGLPTVKNINQYNRLRNNQKNYIKNALKRNKLNPIQISQLISFYNRRGYFIRANLTGVKN